MLKLIFTVLVIYLLYRYYKRTLPEGAGGQKGGEKVRDILVRDPNCGKFIPKERAVRVEFDGKIYYFCSLECAVEYEKKIKEHSN